MPDIICLGITTSPYPDRILPKNSHEKDLADRTLTKLDNARPAWQDAAHKTLNQAVAAAQGPADDAAAMPDEEILKRLLALHLERAGKNQTIDTKNTVLFHWHHKDYRPPVGVEWAASGVAAVGRG